MNPHMIEPRCLIGGVHIRRLFPDIFLGWGNGFVWTRDLFRRPETNETASRDRDWWSPAALVPWTHGTTLPLQGSAGSVAAARSGIYRRLIFLSQNSSPATFDAFGAELPLASDTVTFVEPTPPRPSWKESPTPTTNAPAAGAYSTQPFGQEGRLNANTVCSGRF